MNHFQTDVIARNALEAIIQERIRQTLEEGYTPDHDDEHTGGQMAILAAAYTLSSREDLLGPELKDTRRSLETILKAYRWSFKPKDPIRDLVRAGALILAELERRLRCCVP